MNILTHHVKGHALPHILHEAIVWVAFDSLNHFSTHFPLTNGNAEVSDSLGVQRTVLHEVVSRFPAMEVVIFAVIETLVLFVDV